MSEDKRKNARTQGRFSNDKEFRRDREKPRNQRNTSSESSSGNTDKRKGTACVSRKVPEGVDVKYEENSNFQFKTEKRKPEELKFSGIKELSTTENGISRLIYEPKLMQLEESEEFMTILENSTEWHDKNIVIHGKEIPQPRLVAWYGPFPYSYSGATLEAAEMPSAVLQIKEKVEAALRKYSIDVELNSVLLNLYRTGKDSVAWHSDDELMMGVRPTIASVSLGEVRKFEMKPKRMQIGQYDDDTVFYVNLEPGSLIIMDGCMQLDWLHQVPKEYHDKGRRINLTFRTVYPMDKLPSQVPSYSKRCVSANPDPKSTNQPKPPTEHIFDNENFPPLNAAPTTKHKISIQDNVLADSPVDATDVTCSTYAFECYEYENNLNKALNPSSVDISPPSYQESNNFNVNEPHTLPDKLVGNGHSMASSDLVRACPLYGTDLDPEAKLSDEGVKISEQCIIERPFSETNQGEVRHQLNANAPDFIPQTTIYSPATSYDGYDIHRLVKEYPNVGQEDIICFKCAIFNQIEDLRQKEFFSRRDWHELDVLQKISDDTQSEKNLRIIMERLCSMVENAAYQREREARSPHRYQNQRPFGEYSGGYRPRHRNSYKPNTYRH